MGYRGDNPAQLFDDEPLQRLGRRVTRRATDELVDRARSYTPVAKAPPGVSSSAFTAERGGRRPGTMRDHWEAGPVHDDGDGHFHADALNDDPAFEFVEYDTRPHSIDAKPGGTLRFRGHGGAVRYATHVDHPGTTGAHMTSRAAAEIDEEWPALTAAEFEAWAREQGA